MPDQSLCFGGTPGGQHCSATWDASHSKHIGHNPHLAPWRAASWPKPAVAGHAREKQTRPRSRRCTTIMGRALRAAKRLVLSHVHADKRLGHRRQQKAAERSATTHAPAESHRLSPKPTSVLAKSLPVCYRHQELCAARTLRWRDPSWRWTLHTPRTTRAPPKGQAPLFRAARRAPLDALRHRFRTPPFACEERLPCKCPAA